jgi:hypothetical protein
MTDLPILSLMLVPRYRVAYHRAAGVYIADKDMQELGTAAVHLLTIGTSYTGAQKE